MEKSFPLVYIALISTLFETANCLAQKVGQFDNFFRKTKQFKIHQNNGLSGVFGEIVCTENGNLIIVDVGSKNVVVFDSIGKKLMNIGREGKGPGEYLQPIGIGLDNKGNIFVSDNGGRKLIKYNKNGRYERFFYFGTDHWIPKKLSVYDSLLIAFAPKFQPPSPYLYENIQIYNVKSGQLIQSFFKTSDKLLDKKIPFVLPVGLVSEEGKIFVCLDREFLIYVFDLRGKEVEKFGEIPLYFKEFEGFKSDVEANNFLKKPYDEQKAIFHEKYSRVDNILKYKDYLVISTESYENVLGKNEKVYYIDVIDLKSKKKLCTSLKTRYHLICMNKENFVFILSENEYENGTAIEVGYFKFSINK